MITLMSFKREFTQEQPDCQEYFAGRALKSETQGNFIPLVKRSTASMANFNDYSE